METDFREAYEKYINSYRAKLTAEQAQEYVKYAVSNRERAEEFIQFLQRSIGMDLKGKRILDIGSAYAGFVILCAQRGAEAYGVEILTELHELALANAKGEAGDFTLLHGNILDENLIRQLGVRPFDLIIVNDVFEHVYDVDYLFARIRRLSGPDTVVFFGIPNATSYHAVKREHHRFVFGLTLLEPGLWAKVVGSFSIYHRPWSFYKIYFRANGFKHLYVRMDTHKLEGVAERIQKGLDEIEEKLKTNPFSSDDLNMQAKSNFERLKEKFQADLDKGDPLELYLVYEHHLWEGFVTKKPLAISGELVEIPLEGAGCEL